MSRVVLVTDPVLVEAVRNGDVIGEIYSDGECYVNFASASRWLNEQPIATLEASAGVEP
jgi:hypothetical protein